MVLLLLFVWQLLETEAVASIIGVPYARQVMAYNLQDVRCHLVSIYTYESGRECYVYYVFIEKT